ncbi:MAG: HDOD domain-containing protein [Deltaproteobacteria bacterium]|nr:HDOD domain-containing protein [Deltaproteobacteria bacterium]MBN2671062.1 HDOD domain-containing protein [Deltaproteobacteria bacterium]
MNSNQTDPNWLMVDVEQRPQALLDELAGSVKISPAIQELMNLTRRPDSVMKPVVEALSKSPSLAAEVLKVANSPIFAHSKEVMDLKRAVVLIGMQELHAMAAGLHMLSMFSSDNEISGAMRETSVVSATIARRLAERTPGIDPINAFLCGLLCEIGALACNSKDSEGYTQIWNQSHQRPTGRFQLETKRYGVPTEATGGKLLALNGLPKTVAEAIHVGYDEAATTTNILGKITCFSRFAAYVLVDAGATGERAVLENGIGHLAAHMNIQSPPLPQLITLCLDAGIQANLGLRGKADLYVASPAMQNDASDSDEGIDIAVDDTGRSPIPDITPQKKKKGFFSRLFG